MMKQSQHPILAIFDKEDGSLHIPLHDLRLNFHLSRVDFINATPPIALPENPRTVETFYFNDAVEVWNRQFMLSVSFRAHTTPFCTGYKLQPLFEVEREQYESTDNIAEFENLKNLVIDKLGKPTRFIPEIVRVLWEFGWGIVSVGSVMQDSSPYAISVGWPQEKLKNQVKQ